MRAVRTCPSLGQCRRAVRNDATELQQPRKRAAPSHRTSSLSIPARAGGYFHSIELVRSEAGRHSSGCEYPPAKESSRCCRATDRLKAWK
jgi:hypothetical protein